MKPEDKPDIKEFRELVSEIVSMIPKGRATSYGAIARSIGYPSHSRMVGKALADSAVQNIPAHRVVNSQGELSGKDAFKTPDTMQELLESEGVTVENNRIKNWRKVFWDPVSEIRLD
ncbi:MGMT family protein [uncultured Proteiniphilum sp.]|uniref:MGMT family protein n=1 Tax=uncultured Proteiniphilum sp. TaxID=497637 RepID=UPI002601D94A|nr:MGMT family protein [uncultured Proteiniphilum sp.]